jgi:hypothetical protein
MRITEFQIHQPSGCLHGIATSRRGRRYRWIALPDGTVDAAREIPTPPFLRPDGRRGWWNCAAPKALVQAVEQISTASPRPH